MTEKQIQEIMRLQACSMQAMSNEALERRQLEQADGMRNAWPDGVDSARLAQASMNFWRQEGPFTAGPIQTPPTLWARIKRWIRA